jgi:NAD-dependent histone deacetylase SIR2
MNSHVWLFDGAEGGKWLQQLQCQLGIVPGSIPASSDSTRQSTPSNGTAKNGGESRREFKKARVG